MKILMIFPHFLMQIIIINPRKQSSSIGNVQSINMGRVKIQYFHLNIIIIIKYYETTAGMAMQNAL